MSVQLGVDLGGTGTRVVAIDRNTSVLNEETAATPAAGSPAQVVAFLRELVDTAAGSQVIGSLGIGASGPIDNAGVIQNPATLPAFTGVDVAKELSALYGIPVPIENDAVAACIGEAAVGAARGYSGVLMVTLGTGVGVSMLRSGEPVRGADGQHPEAGHLSIADVDAPCYCGRSACWEIAASRSGLQSLVEGLQGSNGPKITVEALLAIGRDASAGEPEARTVFDAYGKRVAAGLADLLTIYHPEIVVLGGSAAQLFDAFSPSLFASLQGIVDCFPSPVIVPSTLGDLGGAIGAAVLGRSTR
ncbi:ROK family protein [Kribbella qitaiheensis]|uniref:ROK family protein n=1 Tax=Kribbella qitaiheensis TaxID=1544730 RepID=A0A7G6X5D1_9ACTN|nr:ROK family protein [Kribbella qitaiheensis]QNE21446.1 ROK family protein [Kribbella qitaiheensis]